MENPQTDGTFPWRFTRYGTAHSAADFLPYVLLPGGS